jgi:hypothetical protein
MLQFSAERFLWCGLALRAIRQDCVIGSIPFGDAPLIQLTRDLDERATAKARELLLDVESEFRGLGMRITAETVADTLRSLDPKAISRRNFQWLIDQIATVESLAKKELREKAFFYVPPERARFFPPAYRRDMFGEAVARAFPSAGSDIVESGVCLGLARPTACVFHLMRVLEIGLTALGKKFGVSLAHTNWAPAIDQIEARIRTLHTDPAWKALPDYKAQQEFYAQVASHFGILKDAWRNYTMHARGFHTEEQAEQIYENVKGFMQKLAGRLHE